MSLIKKFILRSFSEGGQKNYKKILQAIILIAAFAIFFIGAKSAMAVDSLLTTSGVVSDTILGPIGAAVMLLLGLISYILTAVIGLLITLVVAVLIQVARYGNIINVPTVIQGWVIIRDLCNMSFILILLIIAFATILRQENYSAKKILPKLLIMAILINFSRTIFGLLIDASQIIMLTFVNAFAAGGGWFIQAFQVNLWLSVSSKYSGSGDIALTTWSTSVAIIAGVLAAIITLIIMSVMLAVLVARIVMLWIYTIFSPLIFLGFAFPPLQKYTGKLWEDFTKQLVVGPVLAFFIWLALTTAESSSKLLSGNLTQGTEVCAGVGAFFCQGTFQTFIIVIGLLMGGLMVAQSMGSAAGAIAGKGLDWAKKVAGAPGGLAKWGGKRLATLAEQKLEEHGMPALTRGYWKGFGARRERLQAESSTRAMGKGEQLAEERWKLNPFKKRAGAMDRAEMQRRAVINKIIGDIGKSLGSTADPRQEMQHQAKLAFEAEGIEGEQRREAIIEMATSKGNLDDVYFSLIPQFLKKIDAGKMNEKDFAAKYKMKPEDAKTYMEENKMEEKDFVDKFGMSAEDAETYGVNSARKFVAGYLGIKKDWAEAVEMPEVIEKAYESGGEDDPIVQKWLEDSRAKVEILTQQSSPKEQNKLRTMAAASEVCKGVGHWEQFTTVKDDITGKYKMLPELDRHVEALGEFNKRPISDTLQHTATHPMRVTVYDEKTKDWSRSSNIDKQQGPEKRGWRDFFGSTHMRDIHRTQKRMADHMIGQFYDMSARLIDNDDEAKKRGFKDAATLQRSAEEMRKANKIMYDGFYRLKFYKKGDAEMPVYDDYLKDPSLKWLPPDKYK